MNAFQLLAALTALCSEGAPDLVVRAARKDVQFRLCIVLIRFRMPFVNFYCRSEQLTSADLSAESFLPSQSKLTYT